MFTIALIISAEQSNQFGSHYWRIFEHLGWLHFHETKNTSKSCSLETHAHKNEAGPTHYHLIWSSPGLVFRAWSRPYNVCKRKVLRTTWRSWPTRYTLLVFSPIHGNYIWYTDCCKLFMRHVMQREQNLGKTCLMFSDCIVWHKIKMIKSYIFLLNECILNE